MKKINHTINLIYLLTLIAGTLLFSSCEDKIDVDLEQVAPLIVVDAWLTDEPGKTQEIVITKTQPYFDSSAAPEVSNALVNVAPSDNDILIGFQYVGNGRYTWTPAALDGDITNFGDRFELLINIDGVEYRADATVNRTPDIEEIRQEVRNNELGSIDGGIYCEFIARDFVGQGDTYWIKSYKNGVFLNKPEEINIAYEAGFDAGADSDGVVFITPIRELTNPVPDSIQIADDISPWAPGDICKVEIHSISNDAFAFMELARDQILNGNNGIFAEPLANSPGNVTASDGSTVLGVFNVARVSSKEIIVQ